MLRQNFGASPYWHSLTHVLDPVLDALGRIAVVAETSTRVLLDLFGWRGRMLSSSLLAARPGRSSRLADLAAATGARAYLCGTGGMTYLDPAPFAARNIPVAAFRPPTTGIWSTARRLSSLYALAALGPDTLAARLRSVADDNAALAAATAGYGPLARER
ncbi:WbqC family protein [Streptomyces sp. SPB074]|uniref:WbqC family protein n=1 Tax=Streptomyces sp. (strain SPB074) TaxID=465543 RepID=UPI00017F2201|nr:WbqC family protein [Streptomyces sp. SPB074]